MGRGAHEVDGRLDVLDEGGGALVVGGRVAVQAPDVVGLPSAVGHRCRVARSQPPCPPRRAAADKAHHLLRPCCRTPSSSPQPRLLRSAVASRRLCLSSASRPLLLGSFARSLARLDDEREKGRGQKMRRERERGPGWVGLPCFLARAGGGYKNLGAEEVGPTHELSMRGPRGRGEESEWGASVRALGPWTTPPPASPRVWARGARGGGGGG